MKKQRTNPQPAVPILGRDGKITLVSRTPPAPGPRIRYEDLTNTVTRSSCTPGRRFYLGSPDTRCTLQDANTPGKTRQWQYSKA